MCKVQCPDCNNEYKRVGSHWSQSSSCGYPELTDHQREVATGLLMGDGYINRGDSNPRLESEMISQNYLHYIDNIFGILGTGVSLKRTAEQKARQMRESGFSPDAESENYSETYIWRTRCHPGFKQFAKWYSSGEKVWPRDIDLTPTVLRNLYVCDGSWDKENNRIKIGMSNEIENRDKVEDIFRRKNLPTPSNWEIYEFPSKDAVRCSGVWSIEGSKDLWSYMGEPLPDFEYKWPDEFR